MLRRTCLFTVAAVLIASSPVLAQDGAWSRLWERLSDWDGAGQVVVTTDYGDPYGERAYRRLINGLLDREFTVMQSREPGTLSGGQGLRADLRKTENGPVVAITQIKNGAIVALQPIGESAQSRTPARESRDTAEQSQVKPEAVTPKTETSNTGTSESRTRSSAQSGVQVDPRQPRRIDIDGRPKRLAVVSDANERLEMALLYNDRLDVVELDRGQLIDRGTHEAEARSGNALYVGVGDIDDNGDKEIAAVWGQDVSLNDATITRVSGRVLSADTAAPKVGPTDLYLRIVGNRLYSQARTDTNPFAGPVRRLTLRNGTLRAAEPSSAYADLDLYTATPIEDGTLAAWTGRGRLGLIAAGDRRTSGSAAVGLGVMSQPELMIRREKPQNLTGPEAGYGRIYDKAVPLPRRVIAGADGALYTIERSRSGGFAGLTGSTGRDQVVQLSMTRDGLRQTGSFGKLDWFILDFDLVDLGNGRQGAVVLANQAADGSRDAAVFLMGFPQS